MKRSTKVRSRGRRKLSVEGLEDRRVLATFTVTSTADSGAGSLREAIEMSNQLPGVDLIDFSQVMSGQTILLTSDELHIQDSVTIDGSSVTEHVTIDASGADATPGVPDGAGIRSFYISDEAMTSIEVTISSLAITGGDVTGDGGAIFSKEVKTS